MQEGIIKVSILKHFLKGTLNIPPIKTNRIIQNNYCTCMPINQFHLLLNLFWGGGLYLGDVMVSVLIPRVVNRGFDRQSG